MIKLDFILLLFFTGASKLCLMKCSSGGFHLILFVGGDYLGSFCKMLYLRAKFVRHLVAIVMA